MRRDREEVGRKRRGCLGKSFQAVARASAKALGPACARWPGVLRGPLWLEGREGGGSSGRSGVGSGQTTLCVGLLSEVESLEQERPDVKGTLAAVLSMAGEGPGGAGETGKV